MRSIGEVSETAGVTVRTLHHYDEVGLLCPTARSEAGYRLYSHEDLARLQEILVWRRLGFTLAEIQQLLDDPGHDRVTALGRQRELVLREADRLAAIARALDATITAHENGTEMEGATMFDGLDQYADEARERWGQTDAYQESARRTEGYGEGEWTAIGAESERIVRDFAALLEAGEDATGQPARVAAERHRQHISQWFYPCSSQMHRRLGEMYVADERFARSYERTAPGLAVFVRDAFAANAGSEAPLGS